MAKSPGADRCDRAVDAGQVPPDFVEPGVSLDQAERDWRSFRLDSPRLVMLETAGDPLLCDTNLTLWGACERGIPRRAIAFSEDRSATDYTSRIPREGGLCIPVGTYWVEVGSFLDAGTGAAFELAIRDLGECTPVLVDEFEPDDELALASRIQPRRGASGRSREYPRAAQQRTIAPMGDIDFARFTLAQPRRVRIRTGVGGNADTILGLGEFGSGIVYAVNDNASPDSLASQIETCLPANEWFVVAIGKLLSDSFEYELLVDSRAKCRFEEEPNGDPAWATGLTVGHGPAEIHGVHTNVAGIADNDYYRFDLSVERGVVLETSGYDPLDVDTFLELYDARGNLLANDEDGGLGWLSRIEASLPAGTYFAKVTMSPFELPEGDTWVYGLAVTLSEPPVLEIEPNDLCGQANSAPAPGRVLAAIEPVGDADHYEFTVGPALLGGVEVEIQTRSVGDPVLELFEDPGACVTRIGCDDDSAPGLDALLSCCLPADAEYVVRISDFASNSVISTYSVEFRIGGECVPSGDCPVQPSQFGCE